VSAGIDCDGSESGAQGNLRRRREVDTDATRDHAAHLVAFPSDKQSVTALEPGSRPNPRQARSQVVS